MKQSVFHSLSVSLMFQQIKIFISALRGQLVSNPSHQLSKHLT